MEPEVKEFLKRIMYSLFMGLLWMALNSTFGIMFDFGFVHDSISVGNIIFYIWFLSSLAALIWYYVRLWKEPLRK